MRERAISVIETAVPVIMLARAFDDRLRRWRQ